MRFELSREEDATRQTYFKNQNFLIERMASMLKVIQFPLNSGILALVRKCHGA